MKSSAYEYRDKPTLLELRERFGVNIVRLADISDVPPAVVYCMLLHRPVSRSKALSVLKGLSMLRGMSYSLENVDVVLSEEVGECSDN